MTIESVQNSLMLGVFVTKNFRPPHPESLTSIDRACPDYSSEISEIVALVSFSSQGVTPSCDEYNIHCFEFAAWRHTDGSLMNRKLTILRPVGDIGKAFEDFTKGSIYRVHLILSKDETRAVFVKKVDSPSDRELESIADQLRKPVVIRTDRFGPLTLDRNINSFAGEVRWNGRDIRLAIYADESLNITHQLNTADALFSDSENWGERVRRFAVREKLELANDWQEDEITEEMFLQRMTLQSICIDPDGDFEFWHDDGDLFWGHAILIRGSLKDGLTSSDIPG